MGTEPFIGEVQMFAGNFAPRGWALCDGQLLSVSQYDALFSLLGTNYGGDGRTTFGLPDLRSRIPIGTGQGSGLSNRQLGERVGQEQVTLTANEVPAHTHNWEVTSGASNASNPTNARLAAAKVYSNAAPDTALNAAAVTPSAGGSRPHPNEQPFLVVNYIIALVGIYPSRN